MQLNREGDIPNKVNKVFNRFLQQLNILNKKRPPKGNLLNLNINIPYLKADISPPYPTKKSIAKSTSKLIPTKADFAPLETRLGFTTSTKKSLAK